MVYFIASFLIFLFFNNTFIKCASSHGLGGCPKLAYMPNFNISLFTGRWYEIERSFYLMEVVSSCVSVDLEQNSRLQYNIYVNSKSRVSGIFSISQGIAVSSKKDPSLFLYKVSSTLPKVINKFLPGAGYYQILKTDYTRYAILYSCTNYHLFHTDLIWIWGRQKEIQAELRAKIYQILNSNHIDPERLILPKNRNCTADY